MEVAHSATPHNDPAHSSDEPRCYRRKGLQKPVEFATVVTDLTTCHNTWFHPDVDRCFVPTEFARSRALKMGLTPTQVTMHGLPIRPTFSAPQQPKNALRRKLGMEKSAPAVLLVGTLPWPRKLETWCSVGLVAGQRLLGFRPLELPAFASSANNAFTPS